MSNKQQFISDLWLNRAKQIHTTEDKYNLTALLEGRVKHEAEVAFLKQHYVFTKDTSLLDLACGNGRLCEAFVGEVGWVTGADLCEDFIVFLNQWKTEKQYHHMDFLKLDLLLPDYTHCLQRDYSLIFLFGIAQIIIDDEDLLRILSNIKKILQPKGHCLIKQTTSLLDDDLHIDHFSTELNQRWVAHYRNAHTIAQLCSRVGLKLLSHQPIYNAENLGEHYAKVERWANTRQVIFDVMHE